jgi:hypothetical protein
MAGTDGLSCEANRTPHLRRSAELRLLQGERRRGGRARSSAWCAPRRWTRAPATRGTPTGRAIFLPIVEPRNVRAALICRSPWTAPGVATRLNPRSPQSNYVLLYRASARLHGASRQAAGWGIWRHRHAASGSRWRAASRGSATITSWPSPSRCCATHSLAGVGQGTTRVARCRNRVPIRVSSAATVTAGVRARAGARRWRTHPTSRRRRSAHGPEAIHPIISPGEMVMCRSCIFQLSAAGIIPGTSSFDAPSASQTERRAP